MGFCLVRMVLSMYGSFGSAAPFGPAGRGRGGGGRGGGAPVAARPLYAASRECRYVCA